jgi:hypothetical protein
MSAGRWMTKISVGLAADWWGGSPEELQVAVIDALQRVGARRAGDPNTLRLDQGAQRRLGREAQIIRNRTQLVRNGETIDLAAAQVGETRAWVLRTRADLRRAWTVAEPRVTAPAL